MDSRTAIAMICLSALLAGSAFAACAKPETPACALERVPFASDKAADDCRKAMLGFRDAMTEHASCLEQNSTADAQGARDDYESIRVRFNQRARGEF